MSSSKSQQKSDDAAKAPRTPSLPSRDIGLATLALSPRRSGNSSSSSSLSPVSRLIVGRSKSPTKRSSASMDKSYHTPAPSLAKSKSSGSSSSSSMSSESRRLVGAPKTIKSLSAASTDRSFRTPGVESATTSSTSVSSLSDQEMNELLSNLRTIAQFRHSHTPSPSRERRTTINTTEAAIQAAEIHSLHKRLTDAKCKLIIYEADLNNKYTGDITQMRRTISAQKDNIDELVQQIEGENEPTNAAPYNRHIREILQKYGDPGRRIAILKKELTSLLAYQKDAEVDITMCEEGIRELRRVIWNQQREIAETKAEGNVSTEAV